jgi:CRISPR-associated endonuclease/helicase Cas3
VSTQLIEAGVDVDFPFVMRELGPFEAVIQAAGRCNREGRLNLPDGTPGGRVVVFRSVEGRMPIDRWYQGGRDIVEANFLSSERGAPRIDEPADIQEYYKRLFMLGSLDNNNIHALRSDFRFHQIAEKYRFIDDDSVPVVVATWDRFGARAKVASILKRLQAQPRRSLFRKLTPYQVNMRFRQANSHPDIEKEIPGVYVWRGHYDRDVGVTDEARGEDLIFG